ncbi:MAG TPA: ethanolamine utilization protein EutJ [Syntrophobacteraceae bacterium]|nr:ethanolamine utilization protein EutJ [Syntrophobacteraceae bacterium]
MIRYWNRNRARLLAAPWIAAWALWLGTSLAFAEVPTPVRIGAIFSETGMAAEYNRPSIDAAVLAVEELNRRGGLLGTPIELLILDNQSTPLGSKLAAEEAVARGVTAVVGAALSSQCFPIAQVLQEAKIPMITPIATHPQVTLVGDYIFRMCFTDDFQGSQIARFAITDLRARKAVVLVNSSETYSSMLAESFANTFQGQGGKILWHGLYKGNAVDFSELLNQIGRLNPDVVFVPGYARDSGLILKQALKVGIRTQFLGGDGWSPQLPTFAGKAADGAFYSTHWHPALPSKENERLREVYRRKYGHGEYYAPQVALTYDAMMLLADAIQRAGCRDRATIREALANTRDFEGATGILTFDSNRNPVHRSLHIVQFADGHPHLFKTIAP